MTTENIEGFVVDIACLRRYGVADTLERARVHTTECALMGHGVESGYGLVDDDGRVHLLDAHARTHVVTALQRADTERGVRLSVQREDNDGEKRSIRVTAVEDAEQSAHASATAVPREQHGDERPGSRRDDDPDGASDPVPQGGPVTGPVGGAGDNPTVTSDPANSTALRSHGKEDAG